MTPDEQRMIQDLFQRLASQGPVAKDPQADRVISDALRSNRDAGYMLVQTALVYEHQMEEQELRIRDLEDQIADLQSRSATAAPASGGGSFLGGRIGSNRGSVPGVASRDAAPAASPWQSAPQQPAAPQRSGWFGGGGQQAAPAPMAQAPAAGGGFMRSALQTAAGVAGGMMVANSLSGLFGGGHQAHAAGADNSGALRDADTSQDELQDAQLESDAEQDDTQDASYDSGGGDDGIET
jgi:uncharacterized protein